MIAAVMPVSQPLPPASSNIGGTGGLQDGVGIHEEEEEVDLRLAMSSDQIVGAETVLDDRGPGAITPRPLPTPSTMTPAQLAIHNLTHLPYHPGCPICAATRRPNSPHLTTHENRRVVPLLVADYCFMRFADEHEQQPILVMRVYPYKLFLATAVPKKGVELSVIREIVNFIRDSGVTHFVYRSDREAAICTMIDEAVSMLGRFARKVLSDEDKHEHGLPIVEIDDELDAPEAVIPSFPDDTATDVSVPSPRGCFPH